MSLRVVRTTIFPQAPESTLPEERRILGAVDAVVEPVQPGSSDDLLAAVRGAHGLITAGVNLKITDAIMDAMPDCRGIVTATVGFDHIDLPAAARRGIPVAHVPDFCTREVADQTMALLLACVRKLVLLDRAMRAGIWDRAMFFPMEPLYGKTLGIVGLGRIGRQVARRARAFDLRLLATDPYVDQATAAAHDAELVRLGRLLRESDIVSVHTPLTSETRHLLSADEFGVMKPTAIVLNTARGPVIDEVALIQALRGGRIGGAGLDVFEREPVAVDNPLLAMDNVVVSPHAGGYSEESTRTVRRSAAEEMARMLRGEPPRNPVIRDVTER